MNGIQSRKNRRPRPSTTAASPNPISRRSGVTPIPFAIMIHGAVAMQANANISGFLVQILQALVLFFVGAEMLIRWILRRGGLRALMEAAA